MKKRKRISRRRKCKGTRGRRIRGKGGGKKRGKMPTNVKAYFKYLNQGLGKAEARKKAGLPPKSKSGRRRKWGPGNPLYDWKTKHGR